MISLNKLVENCTLIKDEYERVISGPQASELWMDWESDWDHGADWQILPVYASERIVRNRYGKEVDWEWLTVLMSGLWPSTWRILFEAIDPDRVSLVAFSRLRAGQELAPHEHENSGHKVFHMGIDIPEGDVGILSSSGLFQWEKAGDWILFNDNKTHSAWNRTQGDRVVFYMDFIS